MCCSKESLSSLLMSHFFLVYGVNILVSRISLYRLELTSVRHRYTITLDDIVAREDLQTDEAVGIVLSRIIDDVTEDSVIIWAS